MNEKQAITILRKYNGQAFRMAEAALSLHIPMKPNQRLFHYECPNCGGALGIRQERCNKCFQKIDWK